MAWRPFCKSCFKFYPGDAVSDYKSPSGQVGGCPSCGTELEMKDENNPPSR
jgi:rRNA maturation endonuclease Nob1